MTKIFSQEGTVVEMQNRIICQSWNLMCPVYKMGLKNGQKVIVTVKVED